ncbi:hypothetical protein [Ferrimonas sp. YFM]|uniref:hypothetical protein n=1 Tax=Ferrimonas sp. YFM TaxID=3028878 RepID=UPI0025732CB4|nr:hypothetical protein [Ferrimonas sp. YFM]BDY04461.1 hypothetical protein F0521_15020 [Ferrimonas sp. YFM]
MNNLKVTFCLLITLVASIAHADLSDNVLVPKEEMNFAKNYLGEIRERNFEYVLSYIGPELLNQLSEEKLEEFAAYFPSGQLLSTALIGSQVKTINETWQGKFSFEYEFESGWAVASVVMKRTDNKISVIGFNVYRTEASQKELNKFELSGKSALHYLVLVLACIVPIFILVSLFYCIKTSIPKRKWLWALFILGGIGTISINWSTGAYTLKVLEYQLFGAGAIAASEYAPWVVTVGFPLGAVIFWIKRKSLIEQGKC